MEGHYSRAHESASLPSEHRTGPESRNRSGAVQEGVCGQPALVNPGKSHLFGSPSLEARFLFSQRVHLDSD